MTRTRRSAGPRHVMMVLQWYAQAHHRGILRYAREAGWTLDASLARFEHAIEFAGVDGIIGHFSFDNAVTRAVLAAGLPVVDLTNSVPDPRPGRVFQDNVAIGNAAAVHFLERGFQHFAFCAPRRQWWPGTERLTGFEAALRARGFACHGLFASERGDGSTLPTARWLAARLLELPGPLAVMAYNDDYVAHVMGACGRAGLRVPDDVAIVGCDNDELVCDFARIPISSVDTNLEGQAYAGAALLDRLMRGGKVPRKPLRVPCGPMVVRRSSDVLAVEHPKLAQALRHIRADFGDPALSVEAVADAARMSRRWLDQTCRERFGRTLSDELRRVRLEHAQRALRETNGRVLAIARACGYSRAKHLRDTLRRETGLTPLEYRRKHRAGS